jgi:hypothetical protein
MSPTEPASPIRTPLAILAVLALLSACAPAPAPAPVAECEPGVDMLSDTMAPVPCP